MTGERERLVSASETTSQTDSHYDVVVLGEILVEVATDTVFGDGVQARLGISGDALNVAAAAAGAGARVGLIAAMGEDELGDAVRRRVAQLGISTELLITRPGQQGVYFVHSDPDGNREFSYARSHSVGSTLSPEDLDLAVLGSAGAVVTSGITCAISASARAAVLAAAEAAQRFVYDPNYRPRLWTAEQARESLHRLAPLSWLVTPSHPGETQELLRAQTPQQAARALAELGTQNVGVTCGAEGVYLASNDEADIGEDGATEHWIPPYSAPEVLDQTGAGDSFLGTTTARAVLGDSLAEAARWGAAAASLVVGGLGGTGLVPTAEQIKAHMVNSSTSAAGHPEATDV